MIANVWSKVQDIATREPVVVTPQMSLRVAGAMSPDVVSVRPHDTLYDAAVDMLDLGIRHVPVLDEHGAVLGVVSVRDLLRPLLTASLDR